MKRKTINDILLITAALLLSIIILLLVNAFTKEGKMVEITVDGELYGTYSLDEDATVRINSTNTLEISDNSVCMIYADCDNNTCVRQGKISKSGECIICLPNRVIITILSDSTELDAVAY